MDILTAGPDRVKVEVFNDGTRPVESYVDRAMQKIMYVGNNIPAALYDQMVAEEAKIRGVIQMTVRLAVQERRMRDAFIAEGAGENEVADMIRKDT